MPLIDAPKPETITGTIITGIVGAILLWLGKQMSKKELRSRESSAAQATIESTYIGASKDLIKVLMDRIDKLEARCEVAEKAHAECVEQFTRELDALKKQVNGKDKKITP